MIIQRAKSAERSDPGNKGQKGCTEGVIGYGEYSGSIKSTGSTVLHPVVQGIVLVSGTRSLEYRARDHIGRPCKRTIAQGVSKILRGV